MKRFFAILLVLVLGCSVFAGTKFKTSFKRGRLTVAKLDTLMSVNIPNPKKFVFKNISYRNDTLFVEGIEKSAFYEIKDGPGLLPLTRDKQIIFKGVYPLNGNPPVITEKTELTPWKLLNSIYIFWVIFIFANMFFGIFYKNNKRTFLLVQLVLYSIFLGQIFYFQTQGLFSYVLFGYLIVFALFGLVIDFYNVFKGSSYLPKTVSSFVLFIIIILSLFIFEYMTGDIAVAARKTFLLPPKTFYVTVVTVVIGYLLLPAIFFIRKVTAEKKQLDQEPEKTE